MNAKPYAGWLLFLAACGGSSFTANDSTPIGSGGGSASMGGGVGSSAGVSSSAGTSSASGGSDTTIGGTGSTAGGSSSTGGTTGSAGSSVGGASLGGSVGQGGGQPTGGSPDQGGSAGSIATAGSGGDVGGSIGTTGGADPGGSGGVGGTVSSGGTAGSGGSGSVDCTSLENAYLADLAKARICDPSKSQCSPGSTLPGTCGCPVLVAEGSSATLKASQDYQAFTNAGCTFATCGVACVAYTAANCSLQAGTSTRWCTGSGGPVP